MMCHLPSVNKMRRCELLKDQKGMPTQTEVRQQLGPALAEVFFSSVPPRQRELLGLIPPLQGIGKDEGLWVSPSDIMLRDRVILRLPATRKKTRALTHQGILEIGQRVEKIFIDEQIKKTEEVVKFNKEYLKFEFQLAKQDAIQATKINEIAKCELQKSQLLKTHKQILNYNLAVCERELRHLMLRKIQVERREVEKLFRSQMSWKLKQQQEQLIEQFNRDHLIEMRELEFQFRAFLESQRNECCRLLKLEANKYTEYLIKQRSRWEARTRTEIEWAVCEERRICAEEKKAMQEEFQKKIDELMGLSEDANGEILKLCQLCDTLKDEICLWQSRILEIIFAFQKMINCMTDSPIDHPSYLLDICRLMTIRNPLPDSKYDVLPSHLSFEEYTEEHTLVTLPSYIEEKETISLDLLRESSSNFHLAIVQPILHELIRTLPIGYEYAPYCNVIKRYTDNYFFEDKTFQIPDKLTMPTTGSFIFHPQGYCDCHIRFGELYHNMDSSKCLIAHIADLTIKEGDKIDKDQVDAIEITLQTTIDEIEKDKKRKLKEGTTDHDVGNKGDIKDDDGGDTGDRKDVDDGDEKGDRKDVDDGDEKEVRTDDGDDDKKDKTKKRKKEKEVKDSDDDKEKKDTEDKKKKDSEDKKKKDTKDKKGEDEKKKKGTKDKKGEDEKKKKSTKDKKGKDEKKKKDTKDRHDSGAKGESDYSLTLTFSQSGKSETDRLEMDNSKFLEWRCDKTNIINGVCTTCGTIIRDYCEGCAEKLKMINDYHPPRLNASETMMVCCECDSFMDLVCPGCLSPIGKVESWQGPTVDDIQLLFKDTIRETKQRTSKLSKIIDDRMDQDQLTSKEEGKGRVLKKDRSKKKIKRNSEEMDKKSLEILERDRLSVILEIMREHPSLKHTIIPFTGTGI